MKAKNTIGKIYVRASPPNPLSLRRGGLKFPFLPSFLLEIFPENEQEKVTCPPPLLKERGLGGEAQLQFIYCLLMCKFVSTQLRS